MLHVFMLLAEQPQADAPTWTPFVPIILMVVAGYFLLFRPMRQQQKQQQAMVSALKKNDKVVTSAGIIGVVVNIKEKENEVLLKIDENSNVRLRVTKSSIAQVLKEDTSKEKDKDKETTDEEKS